MVTQTTSSGSISRIPATIGAVVSRRHSGCPAWSLAWTWKTLAPSAAQRSTSARIASVVTGTPGALSGIGTIPVRATLMMSGVESKIR